MQVKLFYSHLPYVEDLEREINDWLDSNIGSKEQILCVETNSNAGKYSRGKDDVIILSVWYEPKGS